MAPALAEKARPATTPSRQASTPRLISQPAPCAFRPTPYIYLVASELPKKRRHTEVSVPYSGGGSAIGWHNNTLKIGVVFGCDQHPHSDVRALLAARPSYSQGESHGSTINPAGRLNEHAESRSC